MSSVVILLGPPGVGKGTQGTLLEDALDWERIVTGDLLRAARRSGTELGEKAKEYMDAGELVPDELVVALVEERLDDVDDDTGVIFDGFPRNVSQAEALEDALENHDRAVDRVLLLEAPDDVLEKRLTGRRSCPECGAVYNVFFNPPETEDVCDRCGHEGLTLRSDDRPETVRHRLEVYREETEPLVRYYEEAAADVERIDADRSVDEIQEDVRAAAQGNPVS